MIDADVKIDLSLLKVWGKEVVSHLSSSSETELTPVFRKWAMRYRSFAQLHFDSASKGGGAWPALSPKTIARRRKKSDTILRDTGALFASLTPVWQPPSGTVNNLIEGGVQIAFGGSGAHPSGFATVAEIASFHHFGLGHLPKREILIKPDADVISDCAKFLEDWLKRAE
jgi:hypothetical protein